ncbi:hypothetical protein [Synechococcus sp. CS-603]|uniref:hypothetical protein n=1 Tax=Synechococcus sp. CS-603 TaxID=2847981 RepID=UPI00223BEFB0|nr:hypothetical protein [Synechococcus sp. CS-603]MCT0202161.1 hypothetical protein [Synechococcus sp. CS-603]
MPALALTFVGASSFWSAPVGPAAAGVTYENQTGPPAGGGFLAPAPIPQAAPNNQNPSGIRWGIPAATNRSGLRAYGSTFNVLIPTNGNTLTANNVFVLNHLNFPIFTAIAQVTWNIRYDFLDDNLIPFFVTAAVPISIDETSNTPPCAFTAPPPNSPCPDRIEITQPNNIFSIPNTTEFIDTDIEFFVSGNTFAITNENQQNFLRIDGTFRRIPAPGSLGALGLFSFFTVNYKRIKARYLDGTRPQA